MLTRCPHCDATFRVTEAHLNAAKGKVRCGACLKVFNALEHLSPADQASAPQPASSPVARTAPAQTPAASPSPAASAVTAAAASAAPAAQAAVAQPATTASLESELGSFQVEPTATTPDKVLAEDPISQEPSEEELLAELEAALREHPETDPVEEELAQDYQDFSLDNLLEEDEELKKSLGDFDLEKELETYQGLDEQALSQAEAELDAILAQAEADEQSLSSPAATAKQQARDTSIDLEADEELLFQDNPEEDKEEGYYAGKLIPDDELSDSFKELDAPERTTSQYHNLDEEGAEHSDESWAEEMLEELESGKPEPKLEVEPAVTTSEPKQPKQEPAPAEPAEPVFAGVSAYDRLNPEPIALTEEEPGGNWLRTLGWILVNTLLLVALAGQLAWFHQEKLAHHEQLRPIYQTICNWVGCELPPLVDMSKIRNRHLSLQKHPSMPDALVINLMMVNEATFDQPLPRLAVRFSDLNGTVVAQRIFTPAEYLSGEGRNLQVLPANRPVQIALEILDPGIQHHNYVIDFLPPEPNRGS